jgi:4-hydroxybenzoate polyprenyltransferase
MLSVLADYAIFAFIINFIREIVKDIEDINGDYKLGMKTLPIVLGQNRSTKICFGLCIIAVILIMYYISTYFYRHTFIILYVLTVVIGPLIYCAIKLFSAQKKTDFSQISTVLKVVMFTGICSMFLFQFIMK